MRALGQTFTAFISAVVVFCSSFGGADAQARSVTYTLDIPSQELNSALQQFALAAQHKLLYRTEIVDGKSSPALKGQFTVTEAVQRLLSQTDLTFEITPSAVVLIKTPEAAAQTYSNSQNVSGQGSAHGEVGGSDALRLAQGDADAAETQSVPSSSNDDGQAGQVPARGLREFTGLPEIVVTAQKREERLQDVPVPVTAISGELLASNNQLRLEDYYYKILGLSLTTVQPFGSSTIAIRGIVTGYYQSPTVGITVDDVPYTSSTTVGFGNAISDFDPADLARVEVLRGPQGTLYGASSMGGLIKYVTIDPSTDAFQSQLQGGFSSVSNGDELGYNVRGAVNVPLSDMFAIRASAFTRRDPGYIDDPANGEEAVNWGQISGGRLSALWELTENSTLKLSAVLQDSEVHGSAEVDDVPGLGELQQNRPPNSGGYDKSFQVYGATLAVSLGSAELTVISAYATNKNKFKWDFSALLGGLARDGIPGFFTGFGVDGVTSTQDVKTNKFTQEIRLSMPIGQRTDWLFGAFYGRENTPHNLQVVPAVEFTTNEPVGELAHLIYENTFEEYAIFTDLTFQITDRLDVQVGGRESENRQDFQNTVGGPLFVGDGGADAVQPESHSKDNAFTYLLTPRFRVSEDLMTYARFASGYRPGGPNGGVAAVSGLPTEFDPDTTQSYEIGVKGNAFDHALSFDASLYHIDWEDIQLQLTDPSTFLTYYDNAGGAKSQGLELSIESRPSRGLVIGAAATWNNAELTEDFPAAAGTAQDGDRLPFTSRFSGNFSLDGEFPFAGSIGGFLGASVSYVGDRASAIGSAGPQNYPSYSKSDLRAGVKGKSWTMTIYANNIFDERGILNINPPHAITYIQPRTIGLSLVWDF